MVVLEVADHQSGLFQPWDAPDGAQVGLHDEVAVALRPARRLVPRHRLHIDVVGKQIVAAMRLVVGGFDEIFRQEPLADEAALHVDGAGEHGIDPIGRNRCLQLIERNIAGHAKLQAVTVTN